MTSAPHVENETDVEARVLRYILAPESPTPLSENGEDGFRLYMEEGDMPDLGVQKVEPPLDALDLDLFSEVSESDFLT